MVIPIYITVSLIAAISYFIFISIIYRSYHLHTHNSKFIEDVPMLPFVSIIIVARNESDNIENCLKSISSNRYPSDGFEILLVDDFSDDDTVSKATCLGLSNLSILKLADSAIEKDLRNHKKFGQQLAINKASGTVILSTDADCHVGTGWIKSMTTELVLSDYHLITSAIKVAIIQDWFIRFQQFEICGTIMATAYGIVTKKWFSANAANMAFQKEAYIAFDKKRSDLSYASGDDLFFINWLNQNGYRVGFNYSVNAIVKTIGECNFHEFWQQRIRWATKWKGYKNNRLIVVQLVTFLYFLSIWFNLGFGIVCSPILFTIGSFQLIMKAVSDRPIFNVALSNDHSLSNLSANILHSTLHTMYLLAIGLTSVFVTQFTWKDRKAN